MARMRNGARSRAVVVVGSMFIGLGCATYDPFKVPAESIRERVDTVALASLEVAVELGDEHRVRALIEPRVAAMLREGGFEVVPPDEWDRRWLTIAKEIGQIWDPVTGKRDDERYQAARSALHHDLALERGVDAIVHLSLYLEKIEASGRAPLLCGIQRDVYWPSSLPLLARITIAYGACLEIEMYDMDRREMYGIRHGLEFVDTYALQTHARRPIDQRLRDPAVIEEALAAIVGPLATRGR